LGSNALILCSISNNTVRKYFIDSEYVSFFDEIEREQFGFIKLNYIKIKELNKTQIMIRKILAFL
jgi:hypothetical protein